LAHSVTRGTIAVPATQRLIAAALALFIGSFLIVGAGLAQSDVLHDTAHDTRHAYGFPCH
jgi:cobalt transporter subunit CbtB